MRLRPRAMLRLLVLVVVISAVLPADPVGSQEPAPCPTHQLSRPCAPEQLTVQRILGGLRVNWFEPYYDGGSAVTGYDVQYRRTDVSEWTDGTHAGTVPKLRIGGLEFTTYVVRVRAVNANGDGDWATLAPHHTGTDAGVPDFPDTPTVVVGAGQLTVSWNEPLDDGGATITAYRVYYSLDQGESWTFWRPGGVSQLITDTSTVIAVPTGTSDYLVVVAARNKRGWGWWSLIACPPKPGEVPQRPVNVVTPQPPPPATTTTPTSPTTTTTTPTSPTTTTTVGVRPPDPPPLPPPPPPPPPPPLEPLPPQSPPGRPPSTDPPPPSLDPLPPPQPPESPGGSSSLPPQAPPRDMPAG